MRLHYSILVLLSIALIALAGCAGAAPANQAPTVAAIATKTPRPTFTPTSIPPTATRLVPSATPLPSATAVPPTATVAPSTATQPPAKAMLTANDVANVRSGPGSTYPKLGQLTQGQKFEITGKNQGGDWWQFTFNGKPAWVAASMVTANETAAGIAVAANIPQPPAAVQQPVAVQPAQPAPAQPQPTAVPAFRFGATDMTPRLNTNPYISIFCKISTDNTTGIGSTIRVTKGGATLAEKSFPNGLPLNWGNSGMTMENRYLYNEGCKVDNLPFVEGGYTVYLVEGGQQISDPINLTVSGDTREFIVAWKPR